MCTSNDYVHKLCSYLKNKSSRGLCVCVWDDDEDERIAVARQRIVESRGYGRR